MTTETKAKNESECRILEDAELDSVSGGLTLTNTMVSGYSFCKTDKGKLEAYL